MTFKQKLLRVFFVGEIAVFAWLYIFGSQGLHAKRSLVRGCELVEQDIAQLRTQLQALKMELAAYECDALYKERIAREQLQMARKDEVVYFIK